MDQIRYRTLTRLAAAIDFLVNVVDILLSGIFVFQVGSIHGVIMEDEGLDEALLLQIQENPNIYKQIVLWVLFAGTIFLRCVIAGIAVKLIIVTRVVEQSGFEKAYSVTRTWRNFQIVIIVADALGFVFGYHYWFGVILYMIYRGVLIAIATLFARSLHATIYTPV